MIAFVKFIYNCIKIFLIDKNTVIRGGFFMNFNNENNIMNNKSIDSNARKALEQYKLEISSELNNFSSDEFPYVGGIATRKLVELGEKALINEYNNKQS